MSCFCGFFAIFWVFIRFDTSDESALSLCNIYIYIYKSRHIHTLLNLCVPILSFRSDCNGEWCPAIAISYPFKYSKSFHNLSPVTALQDCIIIQMSIPLRISIIWPYGTWIIIIIIFCGINT